MLLTSDEQRSAQDVFNGLPTSTRDAHLENFKAIHKAVIAMQKPGAKVFEVHHAVEHARQLYLKNLLNNSWSPGYCKEQVAANYPGYEGLFR